MRIAGFAVVVLLLVSTAWADELGSSRKEMVGSMVRRMGYGHGIHAFKNYVLRGSEKHREQAEKYLAATLVAVAALRKEGNAEEVKALAGIESVVRSYQAALPVVRTMVAEGKTVAEIDAAVKVSDDPALVGFDALAPIPALGDGASRDDLVLRMVRLLGYGHAIHRFKNFVIRGVDKHRTAAEADFAAVEETLARLVGIGGLTPEEGKAAGAIRHVVEQYRASLPVVQRMAAEGKSASEIDGAVKVSDGPAIEGIRLLAQWAD